MNTILHEPILQPADRTAGFAFPGEIVAGVGVPFCQIETTGSNSSVRRLVPPLHVENNKTHVRMINSRIGDEHEELDVRAHLVVLVRGDLQLRIRTDEIA